MNEIETKNKAQVQNEKTHNLQKYIKSWPSIFLIVLVIIGVLGSIYYSKHNKNSPEYILRLMGKAFVTGEEKYISAAEEKLDTDNVVNALLEQVKIQCVKARHPEIKEFDLNNIDIFVAEFPLVSSQVDNMFKWIKAISGIVHEQNKIWPARIESIEYVKRRIDGELKDIAIATIKMTSGASFKIAMSKENDVWTPQNINSEESFCPLLVQAEQHAKADKVSFDEKSPVVAHIFVNGTTEDLKWLNKYN